MSTIIYISKSVEGGQGDRRANIPKSAKARATEALPFLRVQRPERQKNYNLYF